MRVADRRQILGAGDNLKNALRCSVQSGRERSNPAREIPALLSFVFVTKKTWRYQSKTPLAGRVQASGSPTQEQKPIFPNLLLEKVKTFIDFFLRRSRFEAQKVMVCVVGKGGNFLDPIFNVDKI